MEILLSYLKYTLLKKKKSLLESRFILENLIANFQDTEVLENVSQHWPRGAKSHSHSSFVQLVHCGPLKMPGLQLS